MKSENIKPSMLLTLKTSNKSLKGSSRSIFKSSKQNYKGHYKSGLKEFPKMSEEEILLFRKQLRREKRITDIKQIVILLLAIGVVVIGISYFIY